MEIALETGGGIVMVVRVGKIGAMGGMEGEEADDGEEEVDEEGIGVGEDTEMLPYRGDDMRKKRGDDQMKPGLMAVMIYLQLFRVLYDTLLGWRLLWRGRNTNPKHWALLHIHIYFAHTVCIEGNSKYQ